MNNEFDDFSNAIDNIKVDRTRPDFKIKQLKLEHYHGVKMKLMLV